ncbi:acyl-CoA dehydrogenase [Variovorax sp. J22R133]|uniref:acyl-CoA dehydrogenase n=1 Tax=Variovorax brevis TaxID=3053503 RepID=UPI0025771D0E|nr:acyl-CoA dehydrogenase [Variovorax sp. J22R133]MDM0111024.1 acyl-CoA dehydrogenase [Variovorax sp. J22R133]
MLAPVSEDALSRLQQQFGAALSLAHLVEAGLDKVPTPGAGRTLDRWRVLTDTGAHNLSLAKLFEGHIDALAILAELGGPPSPAGARWGTWCAETPEARVTLVQAPGGDGTAGLSGTKAWCTGAATATHALVSCWNAAGEPCLAAVEINQPGITVTTRGWSAVGMAETGSVDVEFHQAAAVQIGKPGDYTRRPGFWHGEAGVAACWYGGALGIARMTRALTGTEPDAQRLAHVGAIDVAIGAAASALRECAEWIDAHPTEDAHRVALRERLLVEEACNVVMLHAGRALGAGPLCRNPRFARLMADLPVYLRQSHAERDLASLGRKVMESEGAPWTL